MENNKQNPAWERLEQVIKYSGLSTNAFASHVGLKRSENLYQIKKGNHGISKDLARQINCYYPRFSIGWLLAGETNFVVEEKKANKIPFYDDFSSISLTQKANKFLRVDPDLFKGAEFITILKEDSLYPQIPVGSYLLLKQCRAEDIVFGLPYYIELDDFRLYRIIRKSQVQSILRLVSPNRETYDELTVKKDRIQAVFQVCGMMKTL